jgi:hypothetical protein
MSDIIDEKLHTLIKRVDEIGSDASHPVSIAMRLILMAFNIANRQEDPAARMMLQFTLRNCLDQVQAPNLDNIRAESETVQ